MICFSSYVSQLDFDLFLSKLYVFRGAMPRQWMWRYKLCEMRCTVHRKDGIIKKLSHATFSLLLSWYTHVRVIIIRNVWRYPSHYNVNHLYTYLYSTLYLQGCSDTFCILQLLSTIHRKHSMQFPYISSVIKITGPVFHRCKIFRLYRVLSEYVCKIANKNGTKMARKTIAHKIYIKERVQKCYMSLRYGIF